MFSSTKLQLDFIYVGVAVLVLGVFVSSSAIITGWSMKKRLLLFSMCHYRYFVYRYRCSKSGMTTGDNPAYGVSLGLTDPTAATKTPPAAPQEAEYEMITY